MPTSAPSRCTDPNCGQMATYEGRCEKHRRKAWANTSQRNKLIDPSTWQRLSRAYLTAHPNCVACGSTDHCQVDHVTEIVDGGAPYDEGNFQTLCDTCHIRKTREARKLRAQLKRESVEQ